MKKTLGILILLLCLLLTAGALADSETTLRLTPRNDQLPDGLVVNAFTAEESEDFSAGAAVSTGKVHYFTVTLNVDVDNTDWNKLVTNGGLGDGKLEVPWTLKAPEGYSKIKYGMDYTVPYWENHDYNDDFTLYDGDFDDLEVTNQIGQSMPFATYVRENELLTYTPEPKTRYMTFRWYKSETDYVTDIIKLVNVSAEGWKKVSPSYVEEIKTDTGDMILSAKKVEDYEIKYRVSEGLSTLTTKIKAPAGATSCTYQNLDSYDGEQIVQVDGDGWIALSTPAGKTSTNHYVLNWKKQDDSTCTQALVITVSVKGSKPAVTAWNEFIALVDGTTMDFRLNALADSLMTVEKNKDGVTGWMNIKLKNTAGIPTVTWTDFTKTGYEIELDVPEGAVKVAALQLPENIFEPIDWNIFNQFMGRVYNPDNYGAVSVSGKTSYVFEGAILRNMIPGDNRIAVYAPYVTADEDRGEVWVFYFYDEDGNLIEEQGLYAIVTVSELGNLYTTDVILEADLPEGTVEYPLLVSSSYTGWELQTEYNIQSGNQAVQMDLTLLDEEGEVAKLEEQNSNVFYLPYPEGMSYESGATWTLRHYLDDEYTKYELLTVTATEHGLRFETDSLSPFVLLWDMSAEEAPISTAPKTGDNTPLALYAALLAISLAAAVTLLRRKAVR